MKSASYLSYLKLILAVGIWAGLYHIAKILLVSKIEISLIIFSRYFIASICLLIVLWLKKGKQKLKINRWQLCLIILSASIGLIAYNFLFFYAESLISGNLVAIMYAFTPCISCFLSAIFFKLRLGLLRISGILIALLGTVAVINYSSASCGKLFCINAFDHWDLGIIYAIGAAICFALYSIINKSLILTGLSSLVINSYSSIVASILLLLMIKLQGNSLNPLISQGTILFWIAMLYMAVAATVIAYFWYIESLSTLGILKTVIFQNTLPIQTICIGYIFFNEAISLNVFVCSLIVILGVVINNLAKN